MKKLLLVAIALLLTTQPAFAGSDYEILNQGNLNACTEYAVTTCIDIMGEPTDIDPKQVYRRLSADGYNCITETLDYYVSNGAIESYIKITPSAIDTYLEAGTPVIAITWQDAEDWRDGEITVPNLVFVGTHASVLIGKEDGVYTGVNSWGAEWGNDGLYHLYDLNIIGSAYVNEPNQIDIYR